MTEIWHPVIGAEGRYEASSSGHVRSVPRRRTSGGVLRETVGDRGYLRVSIDRRGRNVHLLVAEAFLGPRPSALHECRHINGQRHDNRAENLAWGTKSENRQDSVLHGTHTNAAKAACPVGHAYDEENTYVSPAGDRRCRTCGREKQREQRALKRRDARTRARSNA